MLVSSASAAIGGRPNSTLTGAPARADRSVAMLSRTAAGLLKRVLLSELR